MSLGPLMIDLEGTELTALERELLGHPLIGGVILFTRNYRDPAQLSALVAAIHARRTPPLIVGVDQEGGRVQRFRAGFSLLPPPRRIGHEFDLEPRAGLALARAMGWLMAAELRAHGVDISFAPCVDLDRGVSEVIGDRAFHSSAEVVSQLAAGWMHGMREAGMAATAKHFPGHGAVVADSHLTLPVDRRPLADLAPDLAPYRRLIANGLPAVMVAHVLFSAVDPAPASLSAPWIRDVLRGELGFQGVVFTDDLSMGGAAAAYGDIVTRARQALSAGCDMLPVCNNRTGVIELLERLAVEPQPASSLRLVRLHGRAGAPDRPTLEASPEWARAQELLARAAAAPALTLVDPGRDA
jgi:beta-N-acetylhexosaminidase